MIAAGVILTASLLAAGWLLIRKKLWSQKVFLKLLIAMLPLPYIANSFGWYVTEAGRQPWIVTGLQKTAAAVSPNITTPEVWLTMIGFTLVYLLLAIAAIYISVKFIQKDSGPVSERGSN